MRIRARTPQQAALSVGLTIGIILFNVGVRRTESHVPHRPVPPVAHVEHRAPAPAPHGPIYDPRSGYHPGTTPEHHVAPPSSMPWVVAGATGGSVLLFGLMGAWWLWPREPDVSDDGLDDELRALVQAHEERRGPG